MYSDQCASNRRPLFSCSLWAKNLSKITVHTSSAQICYRLIAENLNSCPYTHLRQLIKVFPAIELLGFCVPCQKWTLKLLSKIPPCVRKAQQAVWKGSFLLQMQRRQKPNARNRPGKKKKEKKETRTRRRERSDKGANKETARKLASTFKTSGTEDEKKADLKKS